MCPGVAAPPSVRRMADGVQIPCFCRGVNPACVLCDGAGSISRQACARCQGSGHEASTEKDCLDCRGRGYRQPDVHGDDVVIL